LNQYNAVGIDYVSLYYLPCNMGHFLREKFLRAAVLDPQQL